MMKRFVLCLLVLCLLPVLALGEYCVTTDVNGVLVPLTGFPEVLREADREDAWSDSVQLAGFCNEDGAEYTVRTGNVSPLVNYFMNNIPDAEEVYARLQAALNFSVFHIANIYDADIEIEDANASKLTKDIKINIAYTFPGEEGTYHGVITMHDSTVVALLTGDCEHHAEAL